MSTIAAVVFDWAGTMIDFGSRAPVLAMLQVFEEAGLPVTEAAVRRHMGMAKREHLAAILAEPQAAAAWTAARGARATEADLDHLMERLEPAMQTAASACAELIPGAAAEAARLRAAGVRIGSTTGYTRSMMEPIAAAASAQGYSPDALVCAGETAQGRPTPLMLWRALAELECWPVHRCVAVDDAVVGIEAGVNAGLWTVGVVASGNGVGLDAAAYAALPAAERLQRLTPVIAAFSAAGVDIIIESVADFARAHAVIEEAITDGMRPGTLHAPIVLDSE